MTKKQKELNVHRLGWNPSTHEANETTPKLSLTKNKTKKLLVIAHYCKFNPIKSLTKKYVIMQCVRVRMLHVQSRRLLLSRPPRLYIQN